jgi:glutaredoxin
MFSVRVAAWAALVACVGLWSASATAQVFRIIGPDGKVTFSDRPPPDGKATAARTVPITGPASGSSTAALPAELRNVITRYPFTLYTSRDCGPCGPARNLLVQRGVPFTERTVTSDEEVAALQRISGDSRVPFATLGAQHLKGFSEAEWTQYLDAAGYPKASQLPPTFRNAAPAPLVPVQVAPVAPPEQPAPARAALPPAQPSGTADNPAGIRF